MSTILSGENEIIKCREDKLMVPLLKGDNKIKLDNFYNFFIKPIMSGFIDMVFDIYKPVLEKVINNSNEFIKNTVRIIDNPYEHIILKNDEMTSVCDMYDTYGKVFMKYNNKYTGVDLKTKKLYLDNFYTEVSDSIWNLDTSKLLKIYNFDTEKLQLTGCLATIDMSILDDDLVIYWCRPNIELMIPLIKDTALRLDGILKSENKILESKREISRLSLVK